MKDSHSQSFTSHPYVEVNTWGTSACRSTLGNYVHLGQQELQGKNIGHSALVFYLPVTEKSQALIEKYIKPAQIPCRREWKKVPFAQATLDSKTPSWTQSQDADPSAFSQEFFVINLSVYGYISASTWKELEIPEPLFREEKLGHTPSDSEDPHHFAISYATQTLDQYAQWKNTQSNWQPNFKSENELEYGSTYPYRFFEPKKYPLGIKRIIHPLPKAFYDKFQQAQSIQESIGQQRDYIQKCMNEKNQLRKALQANTEKEANISQSQSVLEQQVEIMRRQSPNGLNQNHLCEFQNYKQRFLSLLNGLKQKNQEIIKKIEAIEVEINDKITQIKLSSEQVLQIQAQMKDIKQQCTHMGRSPDHSVRLPIIDREGMSGLDVEKMFKKIFDLVTDPTNIFSLFHKNCSWWTLEVLRSGVKEQEASWFAQPFLSTPQYVLAKATGCQEKWIKQSIQQNPSSSIGSTCFSALKRWFCLTPQKAPEHSSQHPQDETFKQHLQDGVVDLDQWAPHDTLKEYWRTKEKIHLLSAENHQKLNQLYNQPNAEFAIRDEQGGLTGAKEILIHMNSEQGKRLNKLLQLQQKARKKSMRVPLKNQKNALKLNDRQAMVKSSGIVKSKKRLLKNINAPKAVNRR